MPKFYTWVILPINQSEEIGEKQLSVFGSRGDQNSPLMHVALSGCDLQLAEVIIFGAFAFPQCICLLSEGETISE